MWNLALQSLKTYLQCHNINGHQTWHGGNLPEEPSKVTWLFYHVLFGHYVKSKALHLHCHHVNGHQTWQVVTYLEGLLPTNSHERALLTYSYRITWATKSFLYPQQNSQWSHKCPKYSSCTLAMLNLGSFSHEGNVAQTINNQCERYFTNET